MITAWKQPFRTLSKRANADRTLGGEAKLKWNTSTGWKLCAGTVCDQASRNSAATWVCPDMRRTRKETDASVTILAGLADGTAVDFFIPDAVVRGLVSDEMIQATARIVRDILLATPDADVCPVTR